VSAIPHLLVVLHQVQSPENLGAVARVMANFGQDRLVLSDALTQDWDAAGRLAVHSGHVLEGLRQTTTLKEALVGVVYACATTFRSEVGRRRALSPEEAAERLRDRAQEGRPVALVMGGERRGLSDEELDACDDFIAIPTDPRQPSMNLAQAAAVLLYLVSRAPPPPLRPPHDAARLETVQVLEATARQALSAAGFLNPQAPNYVLSELLHVLRRGRPSQREVELWTAAFKQLARSLRQDPRR
jgi:tRNA/rRNA methyltransferase